MYDQLLTGLRVMHGRPPQVIRTSPSLKKLGLSNNSIGKAGCQALTAAISSNQSLKHLQLLPGNPVEEKDAKALAKALKRNNKFSIKVCGGAGLPWRLWAVGRMIPPFPARPGGWGGAGAGGALLLCYVRSVSLKLHALEPRPCLASHRCIWNRSG